MSDDTEDNGEPEIAPPKKSKAIPMMLGLNTLLIVGVLIFAMRKPATALVPAPAAAAEGHAEANSEEAARAAAEEAQGGPTVKLDNFIIQLRTVDTDRYVRIALDLELGSEADKAVINARTARIRDAVIGYFSDRTLDELRGSEGLERTKSTLLKRLAEIVPGHRIKALFVTDFVVQ